MRRLILFVAFFSLIALSCKQDNTDYKKSMAQPSWLHDVMGTYTNILVHDIFSPPVASRNYAYTSIAAYEAARHINPDYVSLGGQLNGLSPVPEPEKGKEYCYELAAIKAMLTTGKKFIFSENDFSAFEKSMMEKVDQLQMPKEVYDRSIAYGEAIAKHILAWADGDNYKQSRSFSKFTIDLKNPSRWRTTPPAFMDAIEPHWNQIRPMSLDSAGQYKPVPHTPFDTKPNSPFMKEAMEVYNTGKNLTEEQNLIANYWDCNPYKLNVTGHAMHATKKITPGGHWMSITRIAGIKANSDFVTTAYAYAITSIALFDGFISCWDEKFRSNLIRPESVINQYIDEDWQPLLQTPPFPEYTSGHSVISAASAVALGAVYGENFAFTDSTEVRFGLPVREFPSFEAACQEAAISRLYG
ncbi:MAG: vanadium-dependent haloperoxidase, partial [Saprospiraceae bacterium]|nr:vanadium-dependent haloperoxidase [Saprospiraceae bacterium]